jgi:hypothetical protein
MELPNINISIEENAVLQKLIESVENFYSLKSPDLNNSYSGYKDLLNITTLKINQLIAEKLPVSCNQLINNTVSTFNNFVVITEIEKQFPNYAISVELLRRDLKEVTIIYSLKLRLSLLTNFFTIFHEETIIHKNASSSRSYFIPIITRILSSKSLIADDGNNNFNMLKGIVEDIFPEYGFVGHELLFKTTLKNATPHGFEPNLSLEYPLYNFLFDKEYDTLSYPYLAP